jgi:basic membrane protein A
MRPPVEMLAPVRPARRPCARVYRTYRVYRAAPGIGPRSPRVARCQRRVSTALGTVVRSLPRGRRQTTFRPMRKLPCRPRRAVGAARRPAVRPPRAERSKAAGAGPRVGVVFDVGGRGGQVLQRRAWTSAPSVRSARSGRACSSSSRGGVGPRGRPAPAGGGGHGPGRGDSASSSPTTSPSSRASTPACASLASTTRSDRRRGQRRPARRRISPLSSSARRRGVPRGALAALVGGSKRIGFVGGMDIPLINKFEAGYRAGVKLRLPRLHGDRAVRGRDAGGLPQPGRAKELALSPVPAGRERDLPRVRRHGARRVRGGTRDGAADTTPSAWTPTSTTRRPARCSRRWSRASTTPIFDTISPRQGGTFRGGCTLFGLKEGGLGYVYDERNKALIPDAVRAALGD